MSTVVLISFLENSALQHGGVVVTTDSRPRKHGIVLSWGRPFVVPTLANIGICFDSLEPLPLILDRRFLVLDGQTLTGCHYQVKRVNKDSCCLI